MRPVKRRRVVVVNDSGHVKVTSEPVPELEANRVLVRIHRSLISAGREVGQRGNERVPGGSYKNFGYQSAGEIVALGTNCEDFHIGQRVACVGLDAGHTEFAAVPRNLVFPLPSNVSYE